ncbi:MAG: TIGR00645 family protein [Sulfuricaulis sp.]|nr:TIGR00645 family protein [Sulfuricaulis sp.]
MKKIEHALELLMFNSRWLLAPFYLGLVFSIALLLIKFGQEFFHMLPAIFTMSESDVILAILTLVDMSLVASLLIIIIFSGYENFVSKINVADHEDRPEWMGKVDFSGLKIKLIASIVAISAIELLKAFVNVSNIGVAAEAGTWTVGDKQLAWKVGIHFVLIVSGVLFALMDRIAEGTKSQHSGK